MTSYLFSHHASKHQVLYQQLWLYKSGNVALSQHRCWFLHPVYSLRESMQMYRLKQWFIHFKRNLNFGFAAPSEFIADNRKKGRKVAFSSTKWCWRPLRGALFFKAISLWALEAVTVETVSKSSSILCLCVELCDNFMCPFSCPTHKHTHAETSRWSDRP